MKYIQIIFFFGVVSNSIVRTELFAQAPNLINYQMVIRDNSNNLIVNRQVRLRISLLADSVNATSAYVETHQVTTTNQGLAQLAIGGGALVTGSFGAIPWSRGKMFAKIEIDPTGGTNYTMTSTTQLLSVPYAMYAGDLPVSKNGDTITVGNSRLIIPGSVMLSSGAGNAPASLSQGLVAFYPFNGNANDLSGNGNNGVVNSASLTTDRFGNSNYAYNFNGTSSYIRVNNTTSLNSGSVSISGWFNTSTQPTNEADSVKGIISKWWQLNSTCNGNYNAYSVNLTKPVGKYPALGAATDFYAGDVFYSSQQIERSKWYHFTFTHSSTAGGKLYINGQLVNSNTKTGVICNSTNPIYIGAEVTNGTLWRFFNGKIDDIRIYNRVLTQTEIDYLASN
jgi:hypothetical protein